MGRVVSVCLSPTDFKAVTVTKKGSKLKLVETTRDRNILGELKGEGTFLALFYPNLNVETVEIPPVKDEDTKEILIKKKLADILGLQTDNLVVYRELPEESTETKKVFRVFAIPSEVYHDPETLPENLKDEQEIFTLEQFSLCGLSKLLYPDKTVFHIYSDESKLMVTVSRGDEIIYTRSINIPSYVFEEDLDNFLYENVNMTYIFVAQRSGIRPDMILLSGNSKDRDGFVESLCNLVQENVAVPLVPESFSGVSTEIFHEFAPCFGTLFLSEEYDFSPSPVKEKRRARRILEKVVPLLGLVFILLAGFLGWQVKEILDKKEKLEGMSRRLEREALSLVADELLSDRQRLKFFADYLRALSDSRRKNPFILAKQLVPLVEFAMPVRYSFRLGKNSLVLELEVRRSFPDLVTLNMFRSELTKRAKGLKGFNYKVVSENVDYKRNSLSLSLRLEKRL